MNNSTRVWLRFAAAMLVTDLIGLFAAVTFLNYSYTSDEWKWALLVADLNAVLGFWFILRAQRKSMNAFFATVMGAMFARMVGLALVLWLALVKAGFSKIGFTISLFIAYICKSVAEMVLLKLNSRN